MTPTEIGHFAILCVVITAAVFDWRRGEIPNWLTLPPLVIAPLAYGLTAGWQEGLLSLGGIVMCGLVPYMLWRSSAIGGGDVKLVAAIGAIALPFVGLEIELLGFVCGGVYALGRLAWEGRLLHTLGNSLYLAVNPILPRKYRRTITPTLMSTVRMGVPMMVGAIAALGARYPQLFLGS